VGWRRRVSTAVSAVLVPAVPVMRHFPYNGVVFFSGGCVVLVLFVDTVVMSSADGLSSKIAVMNPVVELDGDEMTRIIWKKIREEVRPPFFFPSLQTKLIPQGALGRKKCS